MSESTFDGPSFNTLVSELGHEDALDVLNTFLLDTRAKLERLSGPTTDQSVTRREAHSIKSSAATFGFIRLSALASELELESQALGSDQLTMRIEELCREFALTATFAEAVLLGTAVRSKT